MKALSIFTLATCLSCSTFLSAQNEPIEVNTTQYKAHAFGSASTGSYTPFWMVSNRYGVVPLDANNGVFSAGVFHSQTFGQGFRWGARSEEHTS